MSITLSACLNEESVYTYSNCKAILKNNNIPELGELIK